MSDGYKTTSWNKAINFTLDYEGGWVHHLADRGGETFRGISRNNWPSWDGWAEVDRIKKMGLAPGETSATMMCSQILTESVFKFYRREFWDTIRGDELPGKIAASVFDMGVHSGHKTAVRLLQTTIGASVDGIVGPATVKAAYKAGEGGLVDYLAARAAFLSDIISRDPTQKVWARNWFRRLFKLGNLVLEGTGVEFGPQGVAHV